MVDHQHWDGGNRPRMRRAQMSGTNKKLSCYSSPDQTLSMTPIIRLLTLYQDLNSFDGQLQLDALAGKTLFLTAK